MTKDEMKMLDQAVRLGYLYAKEGKSVHEALAKLYKVMLNAFKK